MKAEIERNSKQSTYKKKQFNNESRKIVQNVYTKPRQNKTTDNIEVIKPNNNFIKRTKNCFDCSLYVLFLFYVFGLIFMRNFSFDFIY